MGLSACLKCPAIRANWHRSSRRQLNQKELTYFFTLCHGNRKITNQRRSFDTLTSASFSSQRLQGAITEPESDSESLDIQTGRGTETDAALTLIPAPPRANSTKLLLYAN
ncbi:uncharacterized [Tachysurus ichikawai]